MSRIRRIPAAFALKCKRRAHVKRRRDSYALDASVGRDTPRSLATSGVAEALFILLARALTQPRHPLFDCCIRSRAIGNITAYVDFGWASRHRLRPRTQPMSQASICAGVPTCFGRELGRRGHPLESNNEPINSFRHCGQHILRGCKSSAIWAKTY